MTTEAEAQVETPQADLAAVNAVQERVAAAEAEALDQAEPALDSGGDPEGDSPVLIEAAEPPLEAEGDLGLDPAQLLTPAELPQAIEAMLLASRSPLSMALLKDLTGMAAAALEQALAALGEKYAEIGSGIVLTESAGGWILRTSERQKSFVRKLLGVKPQRLTRAALETLALVAYRQPVTRPEIEEVRGVDCGAVMKALLERRMVKILGKKEEPGRPLLYGTTRDFLEFFGLKSLTALPTLREFRELTEESRTILEKETGEVVGTIEGMSRLADGALTSKLEETAGEGAEAMADLEAAMHEAEARAKVLEAQINPPDRSAQAAELLN